MSMKWFKTKKVWGLNWSRNSSDMNPIENLWKVTEMKFIYSQSQQKWADWTVNLGVVSLGKNHKTLQKINRKHAKQDISFERFQRWIDTLSTRPISGRVDRACATEAVDSGSIPGRVKPKTIKIGIHSFLPSWRSALKGTVWSLRHVW